MKFVFTRSSRLVLALGLVSLASAPVLVACADGGSEVSALESAVDSEVAQASEADVALQTEAFAAPARSSDIVRGPIIIRPDPWKGCSNYAELQNVLKGTPDFYATGYNLKCDWHNSDVQEHLTITNVNGPYLAPGSLVFYCAKGGAAGKKTLWGTSLPKGSSLSEFLPWGSGPTCLAKGILFVSKNPPK